MKYPQGVEMWFFFIKIFLIELGARVLGQVDLLKYIV